MAGTAKFAWTDGGAQSITLQLRVQQQVYGRNRPTFSAESLDGSVIEVISIGSGQYEIVCMVGPDSQHSAIRDWLDALRRGISQTFTPDTDVPATTFTVTAVPPVPQLPELSDQGKQDLVTAGPLRFRRLDGGAFTPS